MSKLALGLVLLAVFVLYKIIPTLFPSPCILY